MHAGVSDLAESAGHSHTAPTGIAFRPLERRRHSDLKISRLNTPPACTLVNASRPTLRLAAHDSGPVQLARLSPYGSLIHCSTPVYPGVLKGLAMNGPAKTAGPPLTPLPAHKASAEAKVEPVLESGASQEKNAFRAVGRF